MNRAPPVGSLLLGLTVAGCPGYRLPPLPEGYGEPVEPTVLLTLPAGVEVSWLGADDQRVCWAERGGAFDGLRCGDRDGAGAAPVWPSSAELAEGADGVLFAAILERGAITLAGNYIYMGVDGLVGRVPVGGGTLASIHETGGEERIGSIAVDGEAVYWAQSGAATTSIVRRVGAAEVEVLDAFAADTNVAGTQDTPGGAQPPLLFDEESIYYSAVSQDGGTELRRLAKAGGAPEVIAAHGCIRGAVSYAGLFCLNGDLSVIDLAELGELKFLKSGPDRTFTDITADDSLVFTVAKAGSGVEILSALQNFLASNFTPDVLAEGLTLTRPVFVLQADRLLLTGESGGQTALLTVPTRPW